MLVVAMQVAAAAAEMPLASPIQSTAQLMVGLQTATTQQDQQISTKAFAHTFPVTQAAEPGESQAQRAATALAELNLLPHPPKYDTVDKFNVPDMADPRAPLEPKQAQLAQR